MTISFGISLAPKDPFHVYCDSRPNILMSKSKPLECLNPTQTWHHPIDTPTEAENTANILSPTVESVSSCYNPPLWRFHKYIKLPCLLFSELRETPSTWGRCINWDVNLSLGSIFCHILLHNKLCLIPLRWGWAASVRFIMCTVEINDRALESHGTLFTHC